MVLDYEDFPRTAELVAKLAVRDDEADADYDRRVAAALPNLPDEVRMDWFRHGTDVLENTCFLDHARLRFRRETWAVDLFRRVSTREDSTIQAWQEMLTIRDPGHLSEVSVAPFMLEHGTWPVPPSVLVGQPRRVGTLAIGPTFLIEGHHRLAYLLSMTAEAHPMLQASHATWVAEESG